MAQVALDGTYHVPETAGSGGSYNTNVGTNAGSNSANGNNFANTFVGYQSGTLNVSGHEDTFVGMNSGYNNTVGENNVFVGSYAGWMNTEGFQNTFIGRWSGKINTTGNNNVFLGNQTATSNTTGSYNTFIGTVSGYTNTSGTYNTAVGTGAGANNTTGTYNTFLGTYSGSSAATGTKNTLLGFGCGEGLTSGSYNSFLGYVHALPTTSNTIILADGGGNQRLYIHSDGKTGINLGENNIPNNTLEVKHGTAGNSGLRLTSLPNTSTSIANPTSKVLSVNANGDVILVDDKIGTGGSGTPTTIIAGTNINVTGDTTSGYTISSPVQTLTESPAQTTGTAITLSNGGGTVYVDGSETKIQAGTNVSVTGVGTIASPYVINSIAGNTCNIYTCDGTLTGNRTVTMAGNNMIFNTSGNTPTTGGRIYIGNTTAFTAANFPTSTGDYRLYVEGGILTEKVKVALRPSANWADYVFASDYKLMPLKDVEAFVKSNKHLPGISSAETLTKEGLDLGEMQAKQMEKIEELTLYAIEQNKKIEKQEKEIEELKVALNLLLNKK